MTMILSEADRFRFERDLLALNRDGKNTAVYVVMGDDGNVAGIACAKGSASMATVRFPKWWLERK